MKGGFTLVELLIVFGITAMLASMSLPVYRNLQVSAQLNEAAAGLAQDLRLAREQSIGGLNDTTHGVKTVAGQYTVYQGSSYLLRQVAYDRNVSLDAALSYSTTLAGDEVNFSKGLGLPSATGTITVTHAVSGSRQIEINAMGIAVEQ